MTTTKTKPYEGPWPRKRHYHRCETCWNTRRQPAVYCYKKQCTRPLVSEHCPACQPLTPTVTHTPDVAPAPPPEAKTLDPDEPESGGLFGSAPAHQLPLFGGGL